MSEIYIFFFVNIKYTGIIINSLFNAIADKLRELNAKQESVYKVPEEKLEAIGKLTSDGVSEEARINAIGILKNLLNWPNDIVFPALDIARLTVLHKEVNDQLCTEELLPVIRRHIKSDAVSSNQMLTFRLLANMFQHEKGEKLCLDHRDEMFGLLLNLQSFGNKNNQVCHKAIIKIIVS